MAGKPPRPNKTPFPSPTLAEDILQSMPALVVALNSDGHAVYVTPSIKELLGFEPEEVLGERYFENVRGPDQGKRHQYREMLLQAAKGVIPPPSNHRNCLLTKSGEPRWILWHAAKGPGDTLIGVGQDVTALYLSEQEVSRRETEFRAVFDRSSDGMLITDENWVYIDVNSAACDIVGLPKEEIIGREQGETLKSPHAVADLRRRALEAGTYTDEMEFTRLDKSRRQIEFTMVTNFREHHHLIVMRDVTSRRTMERQLDQSQKLEAVGQLAGGVAHDFNNMLTAIRGYAELLQRSLVEGKHKKYIEGILGAADRATQTTRQLLAFSRRQVMQPRLLDINEPVTGTLDLLRRVMGEDIELITLLSPDAGKVMVDPGQLSQILMNLVVNSRDAMPAGGKLIIETRNVTLDDQYAAKHHGVHPGKYVMLAVTDTGTGIPTEIQERMFEPFYTTKPQGKGTGLGLAMVYGIVKQSGGYIWVYSEMGEGTTFKIYLPNASATSEIVAAPLSEPKKILIIEDDTNIRHFTVTVLREQGHSVLEAVDGKAALTVCESLEGNLDLVLTDVTAPGMSGEDLLGYFAVKYPKVAIVHMSGFPRSHIEASNSAVRFAKFLPKPFTVQQLLTVVRQALNPAEEQLLDPPQG
ncbi:MAG TPA: PAS domain S-box protein [Terriglobales bacterium]|nr:PAS domain S-box protein [Terriglobales bacterium]